MNTYLCAFARESFRYGCVRSIVGGVLQSALMAGIAATASAQSQPAKQVSGEAVVLVTDDFQYHWSETQYYVRDEKTGSLQMLQFLDHAPDSFRTGATITATGTQNGQQLTLRGADVSLNSPSISPLTAPKPESASASANVFQQKVLVMLVNYQDLTGTCTAATCETNIFGATNSVQALYSETSHGSVSYTGRVVGPYTIAARSTDTCTGDYLTTLEPWASEADTQAQNAGVDLSGYTEKVYVFPNVDPCGGQRGYATIGGSPSLAWIFNCNYPDLFTHEMGHNLGMHHASTPAAEYGDHSDVMGATEIGLRTLDAPHRDQFNWIPSANLISVTTGGTFTLAPLEVNPSTTSLPQALKIAKPDTNEFYYFSFRQPIGYDSTLPKFNSGIYVDGVSVHRFAGAQAANIHTFFLQGLTDGASFVDSTNNITVTQVSHDSSGAKVIVSMGAATATLSASDLSFPDQAVNTKSAAQTLALSNNGRTALSISSIGITGANSGDFLLSANNCAASLAAGAGCTMSVEFDPTSGGTRSAVLAISDSAGTQRVSLSGNGTVLKSDFTLTAAAPTSATVNAGSPASYNVAVGGTNGFASNVNMSCAISAPGATCSASPATLAAGNSTKIVVTTTAHQLLPPSGSPLRMIPWQKVMPVALLFMLAVILQAFSARARRFRFASALIWCVVLFAALQTGCAGTTTTKSAITPSSAPPSYGTQAGSYTVTITGTSGSISHTTTVSLTVR